MGNVALDQGEGRGRRGRCQGRHPYIATGSDPLEYISNNLVTDLTYTTLGMEALHTVTYPTDSLITASYAADGDYVLYTYSCGVLTSVPAGAHGAHPGRGAGQLYRRLLPQRERDSH